MALDIIDFSFGLEIYVKLSPAAAKLVSALFIAIFLVFFLICCCRWRCPRPTWRSASRRRRIIISPLIPSTATTPIFSTTNTAAAIGTTPSSNSTAATAAASTLPSSTAAARYATVPSFVYGTVAFEDELECSVCLMEFKNGERGRLLMSCGHRYHAVCIDAWLRSSSTCPLCRTTVESEMEQESGTLLL